MSHEVMMFCLVDASEVRTFGARVCFNVTSQCAGVTYSKVRASDDSNAYKIGTAAGQEMDIQFHWAGMFFEHSLAMASGKPDILERLERWVEARRPYLAASGVSISMTRGPADRTPPSAWVGFESARRAARLIIWADGQADLAVLDYEIGRELLGEHREITSIVGLDNAEQSVLTWLE
jgi:hypothetical protein